MQNLSCENEFYLHDNKNSFSQERLCTWPRFKTEACGISEMAYLITAFNHCLVFLFPFIFEIYTISKGETGGECSPIIESLTV